MLQAPTVEDITKHTRLVVCFGGIAMKNTQIMSGGLGAHTAKGQLQDLKQVGVRFVNVSPVKDDMADYLDAQWWPCRPNSDVAIMLGIAHTLVANDLHDKTFLDGYCVGFERFLPYLMGDEDGIAKDAEWAAQLSEIPAERIREIAKQMASERCLIGISWSLQRSEFGEQSYWMATLLSAMLGYVGLPGAGVAYGYGSVHNIGFAGRCLPQYKVAALPQGKNAVDTFIPVARIADMLLNPGGRYEYNGQTLTYPDIRLIYWAGGNPFHHHQDLNRLRRAWAKPETIIINEPFWTAAARHADIVFPSTTPLERNDISISPYDCYLAPMPRAVPPFAQSRNDFDIFTDLAERLGSVQAYTDGKDETGWVKHLISNQPKTRLHSQYDHGITSRNAKIKDRAPARMNPLDAAKRNITHGDVIRLFNERGACLAGVVITEHIAQALSNWKPAPGMTRRTLPTP